MFQKIINLLYAILDIFFPKQKVERDDEAAQNTHEAALLTKKDEKEKLDKTDDKDFFCSPDY